MKIGIQTTWHIDRNVVSIPLWFDLILKKGMEEGFKVIDNNTYKVSIPLWFDLILKS